MALSSTGGKRIPDRQCQHKKGARPAETGFGICVTSNRTIPTPAHFLFSTTYGQSPLGSVHTLPKPFSFTTSSGSRNRRTVRWFWTGASGETPPSISVRPADPGASLRRQRAILRQHRAGLRAESPGRFGSGVVCRASLPPIDASWTAPHATAGHPAEQRRKGRGAKRDPRRGRSPKHTPRHGSGTNAPKQFRHKGNCTITAGPTSKGLHKFFSGKGNALVRALGDEESLKAHETPYGLAPNPYF